MRPMTAISFKEFERFFKCLSR